MTASKGGISAMELQRQMGLPGSQRRPRWSARSGKGSYQTAWSWLHKIRKAMVRPARAPLAARVEADETDVGGPRPGKPGRGAAPAGDPSGVAKRWLLGTHHGAVSSKHLPAYLDEFVFRFNRRTARNISHRFARVIEHAVQIRPTTYHALVATPA